MISMMEVRNIEVAEAELWRLSNFVEDTFANDPQSKAAGVFKLSLSEECKGTGTSLEHQLEYLKKGGEKFKKLAVLHLPEDPGIFGHKSIEVQRNPSKCFLPKTYHVEQNCCTSVLEEKGIEELLDHFFEKVLPESSEPLSSSHQRAPPGASKKLASLVSLQKQVDEAPTFEEKARVAEHIVKKELEKNNEGPVCLCDMCQMDDDVMEVSAKQRKLGGKWKGGKESIVYGSGMRVPDKGFRMTANFSLSFLCSLGILSALDFFYDGISSPFAYLGFLHSFFACHMEDLSLFSINFLHHGFPKLWIVVPPSSVSKLDFHLSRTKVNGFHFNCRNNLGHKYYIPSVKWLKSKGIPYSVVLQKPGEAVVVGPNAAHFGFNLGPNLAEAANFATKSWIPYGIMAPVCSCMTTFVHPDISGIISELAPQHLNAYKCKDIVDVPEDPDFLKCLVQTPFLLNNLDKSMTTEPTETQTPSQRINLPKELHNSEATIKFPKKSVHRKLLSCPICGHIISGGHKERLLRHYIKHEIVDQEEKNKGDEAIRKMFPSWGCKLPKRPCNKCGRMVAGSMNAHQKTNVCKQLQTGADYPVEVSSSMFNEK